MMRFRQFLEASLRELDDEEDPWTPEEIEDDARAMNKRMDDYGIEDFDDDNEGGDNDDYITPDDIWSGQSSFHRVGGCIFTFTYSKRRVMPAALSGDDWKEQGLDIAPCGQKHGEIEKRIRIHPKDYRLETIRGRFGNAWSRPIITIWHGKGQLLHDCLVAMIKRNIVHPLTRVYIDGMNQGTIESLLDYQSHAPKKPIQQQQDIPINLGGQQVGLAQIPGLLHSTPKMSPLYAALEDFICKNKDNPQYSHILKHVAGRVNCYRKSPNFADYQKLRSMLHPNQIDNNFRNQKERDRAFDLMMKTQP